MDEMRKKFAKVKREDPGRGHSKVEFRNSITTSANKNRDGS